MRKEDREFAVDCWHALNLLRHPSQGEPEIPEWLPATAHQLAPASLPKVRSLDEYRSSKLTEGGC